MPTPEPHAATPREWALFLGERIVTRYETQDAAADAMSWYIDTYGSARLSEALSIGEVDATPDAFPSVEITEAERDRAVAALEAIEDILHRARYGGSNG